MIKLVVRTILFFIFFILLFKVCERYFIEEDRFNFTNYHFNKVSDTLNFDLLFFGSSKSYCSFNPTIFKNKLGVNTYNLAGQGQVLKVTDFVISESLKRTKPKLIVVDLSYSMIDFSENDSLADAHKSYQLKIFDNYGLSFNKMKYVFDIYDGENVFYAQSPLIRNHDSWTDVFDKNYKKEFIADKNNLFLFNNGYIGTLHTMDKSGYKIADRMQLGYESLKNERSLKISDNELEVIKKIKEQADLNDTKVLFITAPSIKGYVNHLSFYEDLERHMKSIGADYLNLNKEFKSIGLSLDDFKDIQHMNYSGGYKTSLYVSNFISKNYNFNSMSNSESNGLDNNVSYHLLTHLNKVKKLRKEPFEFNELIGVKEIGYFEESDNRFSFIFKLKDDNLNNLQLEKYVGYIRIYDGEIIETNKQIEGFPLKILDVDGDKYIFARITTDKENISKFDIFFMKKETSAVSNYLTFKDLKLQ